MGAQDFETRAKGKTAEEAFRVARERAAWEYGHRGYTGTIAEKESFRMAVAWKAGETIQDFLNRLETAMWDKELASLVRVVQEGDEGVGICYLGIPNERPKPQTEKEALAQDVATYEDKWGPALCIKGDEPEEWIFCGWASS